MATTGAATTAVRVAEQAEMKVAHEVGYAVAISAAGHTAARAHLGAEVAQMEVQAAAVELMVVWMGMDLEVVLEVSTAVVGVVGERVVIMGA